MDGLDLSAFIKTKSEAHDFSERLAAITEKVFEVNFNLENELLTQLGIKKKEKFLQLLTEQQVPTGSPQDIQDFLTKLVTHIHQLPILSVVIAFEPMEETLQFLSQWFVLNIKKQMLLDIAVDPELIGGATITCNGKYVDMSIKPIFSKTLASAFAPPPAQTGSQAPSAEVSQAAAAPHGDSLIPQPSSPPPASVVQSSNQTAHPV